jgi:hypothetical protein
LQKFSRDGVCVYGCHMSTLKCKPHAESKGIAGKGGLEIEVNRSSRDAP